MALTAPVRYVARPRNMESYRVKDGVTIYHGALVGVDTDDGALKNWAAGTDDGIMFLGIAMPKGNSILGDEDGLPPVECPVDTSGMILEGVAVTGVTGHTADVGDLVYATDENTFTKTASPAGKWAVGTILRVRSGTSCDVRLFTPAEYRAQRNS